jgi:hypothetical protein
MPIRVPAKESGGTRQISLHGKKLYLEAGKKFAACEFGRNTRAGHIFACAQACAYGYNEGTG